MIFDQYFSYQMHKTSCQKDWILLPNLPYTIDYRGIVPVFFLIIYISSIFYKTFIHYVYVCSHTDFVRIQSHGIVCLRKGGFACKEPLCISRSRDDFKHASSLGGRSISIRRKWTPFEEYYGQLTMGIPLHECLGQWQQNRRLDFPSVPSKGWPSLPSLPKYGNIICGFRNLRHVIMPISG